MTSSSSGEPHARKPLGWLARALLLTLGYLLVAYTMSRLLRLTFVAAPICLHAGVALAALQCWGRRFAAAVFLGHVLFVLAVALANGSWPLLGALCFGLGAMLQVLAGDWMLRRWIARPFELFRSRDIGLFVLTGGIVTPMVGASVGTAALAAFFGVSDPTQLPGIWMDFWVSNGIGILIGAPAFLAGMAQPRAIWAPRLRTLALPLLLAAVLLTLAIGALARWDHDRQFADFNREADIAAIKVENALREPIAVLAATRGLLAAEPETSREAFRAASERFMPASGSVSFIGVAETDPRDPAMQPALILRQLEPQASHSALLGFDIRALPALAAALEQQARTHESGTATEGFRLPSSAEAAAVRVALVQALQGSGPAHPRPAAAMRVVLVAIEPQRLMQSLMAPMSGRLRACLTDNLPDAEFRQLYGEPGCEPSSLKQPEQRHALNFAGRHWTLRFYPARPAPVHASISAQLGAMAGLLGIAMLVALLLAFSARAQQVEALVVQRTAELRQASEAQRINEQRFRSVFDNAPVGVVISELDGAPVDANPQFCRMLGCTAHELAQLHEPYREEDARLARQLMRGDDSGQRRLRVYARKDGSTVHAHLMTSLLRDAQGEPESLVLVGQDISDQLRLRENEQAREAAEAANRAKSEFLSHMSHELRTPLNGLLGFAQLLQMGSDPLTDRQQSWAGRIAQAGWHLLDMINDILELSRIETGNLRVSLERQDMHKLVDEVLALLGAGADRRGISITTQFSPAARHVIGDGTRIREILSNLVSNAIKYNVEGGRIELRSRQSGEGEVELSVQDSGPGLSKAQLAAMFQPFNRLGQERSSIEGTGIGLVIARRLARLMNGELSVSSEAGLGCCFTLRLPAAAPAAAVEIESNAVLAADSWAGTRRLVYIEDNRVNIEVMRAVIGLRSRLELSVHEDGASGLAAVLAEPPDLLMLDMHLPDADGLRLLRQFRAAPQCAAMRIVMVSADARDEQAQECRAAGASHYMTKPFDVRELLAQLDRLLAQPGAG